MVRWAAASPINAWPAGKIPPPLAHNAVVHAVHVAAVHANDVPSPHVRGTRAAPAQNPQHLHRRRSTPGRAV